MDVFPDELPRLPPQRVVDFGIELHPGTSPISMTPHRMAPIELQELRVQLQELLGKGFVRPEKFQFMEKWQNRNFNYESVITVKNP